MATSSKNTCLKDNYADLPQTFLPILRSFES
jgi:hypothetical protein